MQDVKFLLYLSKSKLTLNFYDYYVHFIRDLWIIKHYLKLLKRFC